MLAIRKRAVRVPEFQAVRNGDRWIPYGPLPHATQ